MAKKTDEQVAFLRGREEPSPGRDKDMPGRQMVMFAPGRESTDLALSQYKSGLIDFQAVLDAQRTFLSVKDNFATSRGAVVGDLVRLYKALGGGWTSGAAPVTQTESKRNTNG